MDVLRYRRVFTATLAVALVSGCGSRAVSQPTLPPQQPLPVVSRAAPVSPPAQRPDRRAATTASVGGAEAPARARRGPLPPASGASFARLQAQLGGQIGVAVSGIGFHQRVQTLGQLQTAIAWSTSKVPVAMAIYAAGLAGGRQRDLVAAITASDNAAAERLWTALGSGASAAGAADAQLRAAGDMRTRMQAARLRPGFTPFGQTVWRLTDQTRFAAGMPCLTAGAQVLGLMNQIVAGERWGLGAAGVSAQFKGGWGPGSQPGINGGYLERQFGIVTVRGTPVALSIAALPPDGSHASGTNALTTIARWSVAHVRVARLPRRPACD